MTARRGRPPRYPERRADSPDASRGTRSHSASPPWWPVALVIALTAGAYANALNNPFVFDDASTIVGNGTIRSIGSALMGGPVQTATAGRPLVNLSFALNYALGGTSPVGYHVVNLSIHVACALVLIGVLQRLFAAPAFATWTQGRERGLALVVAVLWAVHPLNSEVVNYVTQRTESSMALALLLTLYCGLRWVGSGSTRWQAGAVAACAAGMACKETMVVAPLLMLATDALISARSPVDVLRQRGRFYGLLAATWLVLALLVFEGPRWRSAGFSSGVSPWTYLLNQPRIIVHYLRVALLPYGLVLDYGEPTTMALTAALAPGLLVAALIVATGWAWATAPALGFLGTWFFLTLAPTSSLLPIATEVGAERRMYLPLIALVSALVLLVTRVVANSRGPAQSRAVWRIVVGAACALLMVLTVNRNREYSDTLTLWRTVVDRWPHSRALYNLGVELSAAGQREQALAAYQQAAPGSTDAEYALGYEAQADGRYDEAAAHYLAVIARRADDVNVPRAYHQLGRVRLAQKRYDEAIAAFREVLARKPNDPDALAGIADTLLAQEKPADAVAAYRAYLAVRPNATDAMMNMGIALVKLDRDAEARDVFASIVQVEPRNVAAHVNLAYALANTGRFGDSVREFRRALELEQDPQGRREIEAAIAELLGNH
ncbi:MAG: tetratricopeptide repeat protein [Vicinamibacterales bacterium]